MPASVQIYEVGPRDGLQNEKRVLPTQVKAEFIRRLVAAGLTSIEIASFVHPAVVPQLADAESLLALLGPLNVRAPVLVPNLRGLERALACGAQEIAVFASATESFAQRNLHTTIAGSLDMFGTVVAAAKQEGVAARGYVSMCFGDPWEGPVAPNQVVEVVRRLVDMGCREISLGDTVGVATPNEVVLLLDALQRAGISPALLAVHFHDTYGQALANTLVAVLHGVMTVDSSAGGLGGCPFSPGASGNLATEDLVWQLDGMGVHTGVDLPALVTTSRWMAHLLGRPSQSRTAAALAARGQN